MERKVLKILKMLSFLAIIISIYWFNCIQIESTDCPKGYFRTEGMQSCHQLLDCDDYKDMTPIVVLSQGLVKNIFVVKWNDNYLIVSNLSHSEYVDDFEHNIQMLRQLSPNPSVVQLIGFCGNNMLFTEYHSYGDANQLPTLLTTRMTEYNNFSVKLNLCINYIQILDFLHNSPIGNRVMCDSNSLEKTLSQYLLTNELRLVLNDLDALPQVIEGSHGVKCGHRQLVGTFVAPEQLWPKKDEPFNDEDMPGYDHKTDIWKAPDVCNWFLKAGTAASDGQSAQVINLIRKELMHIHSQCKRFDPQTRPSTQMILKVYRKLFAKLFQKY